MFGRKKARSDASRPDAGSPPLTAEAAVEALRDMAARAPLTWRDPDRDRLRTDLMHAADLLAPVGVDPLELEQMRGVVSHLDDAEGLYKVGYTLIEVGLPMLAVAPLGRALGLGEYPAVLDELVIALDEAGVDAEEVTTVFDENPWAMQHESCRAQLSHYAAMAGDLEPARQLAPTVASEGGYGFMRQRAEERVSRADAVAVIGRPGPQLDLRGWEFVLNGSLLLHASPVAPEEMGGRYGALWDSPGRFAAVLDSLAEVLARAGRKPTSVLGLPDRDSTVLAHAIATRWGLPAPGVLDGHLQPLTAQTLVVAYEWSRVDQSVVGPLRTRPVVFFGYALDHTFGGQFSPDVVGLHAQHLVASPWGGGMRLVDEPGSDQPRMVEEPPDARDPAEIGRDAAAWVRGDDAEYDADAADVLEVVRAARDGSARAGLFNGSRDLYYPGGPVRSSTFL